jgi:hypothetical protein
MVGAMGWKQVDGIADMANGHLIRGMLKMKGNKK